LFLFNKIPTPQQIIQVYAVGVTILFSRAIITTIQDVTTRWMLYFDVFEILSLFAYILSSAFLESLLLITALIVISMILPRAWFTENFVLQGSILTISFLGSIMYIYSQTETDTLLLHIKEWSVFFISITVLLILFSQINQTFRKIIETVAERCTVFLYVYMPITILSIIVVVIRNVV
jgi:hypothetical protein